MATVAETFAGSGAGSDAMSFEPARFEDLTVGQKVTLRKEITAEAVEGFAQVSGDRNPLHMDDAFAASTGFGRRVVHGVLLASYVSTMVGMQLPGIGSLWTQQQFRWRLPVFIGDVIEITLTVTHKSAGTRAVAVTVRAENQHGKIVMDGAGSVILPELRGSSAVAAAEEQRVPDAEDAGETPVNLAQVNQAQTDLKIAVVGGSGDMATAIANALRKTGMTIRSEASGQVDVLVNLPGAEEIQAPEGDSWASFAGMLEGGLKRTITATQAALPSMLSRKSGVIVNVGSMLAAGPASAEQTAATMANAALRAYTSSVAKQVGPSGVRVNMISPGAGDGSGLGDRQMKLAAMQTPLRRLVTPQDIADMVAFLVSEQARFLTGADVPVSGGMAVL